MGENNSSVDLLLDKFRNAVADGHLEEVKKLLNALLPACQKDDSQMTAAFICTAAIGVASECDVPEILKYLIEQGGNINLHQSPALYKNFKGSFLNQALYYSAAESALVLIGAGADLTAPDGHGEQPLHYAVKHCPDEKLLTALLDKGADMHAQTLCGETPYTIAENEIKKFFDEYARARQEKEQLAAAEQQRKQEEAEKALICARLDVLKRKHPPSPFPKK